MDQQQTQNIEQATEQLTDSARQSFQMLADRTVALQESNLRLTQNFFQNWIEQVNNQAGQQAAQAASEAGQQGAGAANQSAQQTARGTEQAGQAAGGRLEPWRRLVAGPRR
jgi:hypothetical protein